jgi:N-acetylmuramoyl-L-alanine amidase
MPVRRMIAVLLALGGCTAGPATPSPSALPSPSASGSPAASVSASASASPPSYGDGPAWPHRSRDAAPPALGAVVTATGVVLPRLGGSTTEPVVLTPCGRQRAVRAVRWLPPGQGVTIVVDPGHGGPQLGTVAPDGDREKDRVLQIALELRRVLTGRVDRVVLTRDRDVEATLGFRVALADALRADAAISVHLNASPDGSRRTPGLETFGSVADPGGRRLAGLVYERERRFLEPLGGPWVGDRDAGAKYRLGRDGRDYYGLLRRSHVPWVIAESLYLSSAREAALVARPEIRSGLAAAMADALVAFVGTRDPGSGWVAPYPRPPDPSAADHHVCADPPM